MAQYLGPLELVGDRWVIGDPKRGKGSCLVLTADGMEHHERGLPQPRAVIPWARVMELWVRASSRAWQATRTAGAVSVAAALSGGNVNGGRSSCSVGGILRHPYEPWSVNYTHHDRPYTYVHMLLVSDLFRQTSKAKAVHRLGDRQWLGAAVDQLAPTPRWTRFPTRRVSEVIDDLSI
ncbi:hypothetical protein [Streptomyces sp. NPDC001851]|uniref:hypothetical protein n=1 Tax=Streptomyces sp. NPDC001851 TaxID=3154529 RepID=UPI0033317B85